MDRLKTNQHPSGDSGSSDTCPFFRSAVEVARYLGVSERTVRRLMKNHSLPYTKLGGALIVRKADLEATIEAATFPSHAMLRNRGRAGKGGHV